MSRLNFAQLSEAFYLGSDQIKDTQAEIEKLKKIIGDSTLSKKIPITKEITKENVNISSINDKQQISSINNKQQIEYNNLDFMKLMQHPKFDDIVKNYVILNHPEWVNGTFNKMNKIGNHFNHLNDFNNFNNFKETFGNSNVQNYFFFFIFAMIFYLFLKSLFKEK